MSNRQQKRPASGEPLPSRPAKRVRQPEEVLRRERALAYATKLAEECPPTYINEDYVVRMSRRRPVSWTPSDEEAITQQWDVSIVKSFLSAKDPGKAFNNSRHASLLILWKTSLRIFHMNPLSLVSPLFYMRYQALGSAREDDLVIYSPNFCSALSSLIVHPCFEGSSEKLIQALHYAIVCRLDDREMWPCDQNVGTDCPALRRLVLKLKAYGTSEPPHPIHKMHADARARVLQKGKTPSPWSDFLHHLGEIVTKNDTRRPAIDAKYRREMGEDVLPLTLWDLNQIARAIETFKFSTHRWRFSVTEALSAWNKVRPTHESPSMKLLPGFYENCTKDIFRFIRLRKTDRDFTTRTPPESESEQESEVEFEEEPEEEPQEEPEERSEEEPEEDPEEEFEAATFQGDYSTQSPVVDPNSPVHTTTTSPAAPVGDRRSNSHELGDNGSDDEMAGTTNGLDGEVNSLITSTSHLVRPNAPESVQGQDQRPIERDIQENGSASPEILSTHDRIMYKCLERDNKELRQRVLRLEQSNRHLSCGAARQQERIRFLESEVDRLSEDTGKSLEEVQILSEERLEILDKFDALQRNFDDLKALVTSGVRDRMSPYNIFGGTRRLLSDYQIAGESEQGDQQFLATSPARASPSQSEHQSVPGPTESPKTPKSRETDHQAASGLDVEPEGTPLVPETDDQPVTGHDASPKGSSFAPEDVPSTPLVPLEHEKASDVDVVMNNSEPEHEQETSVSEKPTAHSVSPDPDTNMESDQANTRPEVTEEVRHTLKPVRSINTVKPRQHVSRGGIGSIGRRAPFSSTMKHTFRMSRVQWLERVVQDRS